MLNCFTLHKLGYETFWRPDLSHTRLPKMWYRKLQERSNVLHRNYDFPHNCKVWPKTWNGTQTKQIMPPFYTRLSYIRKHIIEETKLPTLHTCASCQLYHYIYNVHTLHNSTSPTHTETDYSTLLCQQQHSPHVNFYASTCVGKFNWLYIVKHLTVSIRAKKKVGAIYMAPHFIALLHGLLYIFTVGITDDSQTGKQLPLGTEKTHWIRDALFPAKAWISWV